MIPTSPPTATEPAESARASRVRRHLTALLAASILAGVFMVAAPSPADAANHYSGCQWFILGPTYRGELLNSTSKSGSSYTARAQTFNSKSSDPACTARNGYVAEAGVWIFKMSASGQASSQACALGYSGMDTDGWATATGRCTDAYWGVKVVFTHRVWHQGVAKDTTRTVYQYN